MKNEECVAEKECGCYYEGGGIVIPVFLRRIDKETDFQRNWTSYKIGFGSFDEGKDFWLGNEKLHYLTQQRNYTLRFNGISNEGTKYTTTYDSFKIGSESENYELSDLGSTHGNAGDGMSSAKGMPFSTYDRVNVECISVSYVNHQGGGGWWHSEGRCNECHSHEDECPPTFVCNDDCYMNCATSNLNGKHEHYHFDREMISWRGYCNFISVEMKIWPNIVMK
ncbi:Tenascin-X [Holothuria leucospilota]|uniref:Tenascin-X n=1 Tax=Holothuria leucospilota TaxID=206669 RepID=A0A9Q0YSZ4_HOLLE|nr:Tenascin-X [Holothuria leucospilota]